MLVCQRCGIPAWVVLSVRLISISLRIWTITRVTRSGLVFRKWVFETEFVSMPLRRVFRRGHRISQSSPRLLFLRFCSTDRPRFGGRSRKRHMYSPTFFLYDCHFPDGVIDIAKREVMISAGAMDSPNLLLPLGVGPEKELKSHGVRLIANLPGVGKNLDDHLYLFMDSTQKSEGHHRSSYP